MKVHIPIEQFKLLLIKGHCKEFKQAYQREFYRSLMLNGEPTNWEVDDDILALAFKEFEGREEENRRLQETARLNNIGIAAEESGDIDKAIEAYEQNISIGYSADYAFTRLRIIYKQRGNFDNMRRVLRRYAEVYGNSEEWVEEQFKRYTEKKKRPKVNVVYPKERKIATIEGKTLEDEFYDIIRPLPEFDFYTHVRYGNDPMSSSVACDLRWHREKINYEIEEGRSLEKEGKLDKAAIKYEELVANHIHKTLPYERLQMIYKRAKLVDDYRSVLKQSIDFFSALRDRQYKYIHNIADKYCVKDIKGIPLDEYGVIRYYMGTFELYNPYPIIEKWKDRLSI